MLVMCDTEGMSVTEYSTNTQVTTLDSQDTSPLVMAWLGSFSSAKTREAYSYDLRRFAEWLQHHNAGGLLGVTRAHIDMFARSLEAANYSAATRAQWLSALSSFYNYSCSVNALSVNPAANVKRPKLPNYSPRLGLNLSTAPKVVEAAKRLEPEHRALIALCLFTGLRISEALSVKAEDIREEAGHKVLQVTSKGGRSDLVPISPATLRLLEEVLQAHPEGLLLPGIDRFKASRMVAAIGQEANLGRPLTPHDLRHGAVTCALEAGEPLHRVQQLARHASPVTTQRYDHSRDRLDKSAAYGLARAIGGEA
jgi:site-specific recombinase XerD